MNIETIYENRSRSANLTDEELRYAVPFFRKLADDLSACGPIFKLAYREANDVFFTLKGHANTPGLNI